jgi:hypothetical protein
LLLATRTSTWGSSSLWKSGPGSVSLTADEPWTADRNSVTFITFSPGPQMSLPMCRLAGHGHRAIDRPPMIRLSWPCLFLSAVSVFHLQQTAYPSAILPDDPSVMRPLCHRRLSPVACQCLSPVRLSPASAQCPCVMAAWPLQPLQPLLACHDSTDKHAGMAMSIMEAVVFNSSGNEHPVWPR